MSLLMEALKKAEEAKRLASEASSSGPAPAAPAELTLTPLAEGTASGSPLPDLSLHIDSVDADLAAVSTEEPNKQRVSPATLKAAQERQREVIQRTSARNVFSAKQPAKPKSVLWLAIGLGCVGALGVVTYFWWQLQAVSGGSLAKPAPLQPASPQASTPAATSAPAALPEQPQVIAQKQEPATNAVPVLSQPEVRNTPVETPAVEPTFRPPKAASAPPSGADRVRLSPSQPRLNSTLERAYDALQQGRFEEAQRGYEHFLRNDPKNTDALLGIATIAATRGQSEQAHAYYQRALESDPNNPTALAGIANTRGQADPGLSESRLKTALGNQPDAPDLYFSLGNLYAQQARWSEAQQAYFRAYAGDPDNPDFLFNLAVSLDHLRQNRLAAQYYQMALKAAEANGGNRAVSFDRAQARARIAELQP